MSALPEREFWLQIRRGLLTMVSAIEQRFSVGKFEPEEKSLTVATREREPPRKPTNNTHR